MRKTHAKEHLSVEILRERMHAASSKAPFQRWQAIYLLKTKDLRFDDKLVLPQSRHFSEQQNSSFSPTMSSK